MANGREAPSLAEGEAARWASIARLAAICGSAPLSAPAPAANGSPSTCRKSTPLMCSAASMAASDLEVATASYGGWFISPEVTYGYRIPVNAITVTPRLRVRYVGGQLDGYSESGSMQNLTVGRRNIN